jgi:hypothetical protein
MGQNVAAAGDPVADVLHARRIAGVIRGGIDAVAAGHRSTNTPKPPQNMRRGSNGVWLSGIAGGLPGSAEHGSLCSEGRRGLAYRPS